MNSEQPLPPVEGIAGFWTRVRNAGRRFLALDYDGTLAPFRVERREAKPLPGTVELLTAIAASASTRLAVVSGRPLADLVELVGTLPIEMVGAHGFEMRNARGEVRRVLPDQFQTEGLESAFGSAVAAGFTSRIERKSGGIAFHTRGIPQADDAARAAHRLWEPIAERHRLELREFNGGVELRATGVNKGTALSEMLRRESARTLAVYVGDDETDEDAFRVIRGRGLGIKVGGMAMRTAARGRLTDCEAVRDFLRAWYHTAHAARGTSGRA
jgi:trehalose 6-phosphate phosphatase